MERDYSRTVLDQSSPHAADVGKASSRSSAAMPPTAWPEFVQQSEVSLRAGSLPWRDVCSRHCRLGLLFCVIRGILCVCRSMAQNHLRTQRDCVVDRELAVAIRDRERSPRPPTSTPHRAIALSRRTIPTPPPCFPWDPALRRSEVNLRAVARCVFGIVTASRRSGAPPARHAVPRPALRLGSCHRRIRVGANEGLRWQGAKRQRLGPRHEFRGAPMTLPRQTPQHVVRSG